MSQTWDYYYFDGNLTGNVSIPEEPVVNDTAESGGGTGRFRYRYDIQVTLKDTGLRPGQKLEAELYVDHVGDFPPDQNAVLEYTIIDPEGNKYAVKRETLPEGDYIRTLTYTIPDPAIEGEYVFWVSWAAPQLENIVVETRFSVNELGKATIIVLGGGLGVMFFVGGTGLFFAKKKREEEEEAIL